MIKTNYKCKLFIATIKKKYGLFERHIQIKILIFH